MGDYYILDGKDTIPISDETLDEVERLAKDCELASECLRDTNTFETGQAILTEAASMLRALARLRTERKEK